MCSASQASAWPCAVSEATTQKSSSASLVTVRSASSWPSVVEPLGVGDPSRPRRRRRRPETWSSTSPASAPVTRNFDMNDMSISPTPSRIGAVLGLPLLEPRRPAPGRLGLGGDARAGEPVGALPAGHLAQVAALARRAGRAPARAARRGPSAAACPACARRTRCRGSRWCGPRGTTRRPGTRGTGRRRSRSRRRRAGRRDPVREHPAEAAGRQDADGVHAGRDEVAARSPAPRRRSGDRSGVNDSGPQKNVRTPASSVTGTRAIAVSRNGAIRSQSGGRVRNEKSAGMPLDVPRPRRAARRGRPSCRRPPRGSSRSDAGSSKIGASEVEARRSCR